MEKIPFTKEGLERLKKNLRTLEKVERPKNIRAIEDARSHGDINENAEYHAAKEKQAFIEGRINELKDIVSKAEVIDVDDEPSGQIIFGRTVLLYNIETEDEVAYQLVGPYESDPEKGKISVNSPIGQALIGRSVGDAVNVRTPQGIKEFEILEIR
jgi:transcription elongation factor GreA